MSDAMSGPFATAGAFGRYGGRYVPETLVTPLVELESAYAAARRDPVFEAELTHLLTDYVGRPTPLTRARGLTAAWGGKARVYLKREDLCHTGAHKINNTLGQALLAKRMGKQRVIAETGAGQHGVATATAAALLGLDCEVYMGEEDMRRQGLNVVRMRLLGASVRAVSAGSRTLKDAINAAMRDWAASVESTHYILGSVLGPHPFPTIVRDFQSVIGREVRDQILAAEDRLPTHLVACVGGGSNAIGLFQAFVDDREVVLVGVEAGGEGVASGRHAARFAGGREGVLHGTRTLLLQDRAGQVQATHSVSAGLDYPAVGPEHAMLAARGRARYTYATDSEALHAFEEMAAREGIIPALETAHAVAEARKIATSEDSALIVINVSGRGDKDIDIAREHLGMA